MYIDRIELFTNNVYSQGRVLRKIVHLRSKTLSMIAFHSRFHFAFSDSPYIGESGSIFPQTVSVTIYDAAGEVIQITDYGYIPTEQIYQF